MTRWVVLPSRLHSGRPTEELGEDGLYAGQDRLSRFAFGTADEGLIVRGNTWPTEPIRDCIEYDHIRRESSDTAVVELTTEDDCDLTLVGHLRDGRTGIQVRDG